MAGGNKKIHEHPNSGVNSLKHRKDAINRKGRPKKIYTILKEKGYGGEDIKIAFNEMGWYTIKELQEVFKDESKPAIMRITANQIYTALKKADYTKIREIMEHVLGKPMQPTTLENVGDKTFKWEVTK